MGPILLNAMEHQLGEDVLRESLSSLVKEPSAKAMTYADFRVILIDSGATEADLAEFEAACLAPGLSAACRTMAGVGPSVTQSSL